MLIGGASAGGGGKSGINGEWKGGPVDGPGSGVEIGARLRWRLPAGGRKGGGGVGARMLIV